MGGPKWGKPLSRPLRLARSIPSPDAADAFEELQLAPAQLQRMDHRGRYLPHAPSSSVKHALHCIAPLLQSLPVSINKPAYRVATPLAPDAVSMSIKTMPL